MKKDVSILKFLDYVYALMFEVNLRCTNINIMIMFGEHLYLYLNYGYVLRTKTDSRFLFSEDKNFFCNLKSEEKLSKFNLIRTYFG